MREGRGSFYKPGRVSPYRDRTVAENLDLLHGACAPASSPTARTCCARRSTWQSPNQNLRDPVMYRIKREHHHRTGDAWCIYPMYDFAHGYSDAIEGVTHSICTLEFENHRPLYDWFLDAGASSTRARSRSSSRGSTSRTPCSRKRKLKQLVEGKHVARVGRSAHADARRPAAARVHARGDPRASASASASRSATASSTSRSSSTRCART